LAVDAALFMPEPEGGLAGFDGKLRFRDKLKRRRARFPPGNRASVYSMKQVIGAGSCLGMSSDEKSSR